jgi:hypothetical protein
MDIGIEHSPAQWRKTVCRVSAANGRDIVSRV